jgi:hypothetical protein
MQIRSSTLKHPGMGFSEVSFLFGFVGTPLFLALPLTCCMQAFKHILTSPSSVEKENRATRSGNAHIHGMTRVTSASIAYVATQVWCLAS